MILQNIHNVLHVKHHYLIVIVIVHYVVKEMNVFVNYIQYEIFPFRSKVTKIRDLTNFESLKEDMLDFRYYNYESSNYH